MSMASVAPCIYYVGSVHDIASRHGQAVLSVAAGRENKCGEATNCQTRRIVRPPTPPELIVAKRQVQR